LLQRQLDVAPTKLAMDSIVREGGGGSYGASGCPCVTIGGDLGNLNVTIGSSTLLYPADLGGSCETWDEGLHPDCKGSSPPDWCTQAWCYVDPTSCDGLSVPPKTSSYQQKATFRGMTLYYSYATCGASDSFTATEHTSACVNQVTEGDCTAQPKCAWTGSPGKCLGKELVQKIELDASIVGNEACRCIGVANSSGSVVATYPQGHLSIGAIYPSDVGSHCATWDLHSGPDCVATGGPQPDYCSQQWCYVDPCSCGLDSPPTTSLMLPGATYHGKTLYFSYATCGGEDSFTSSSHATACVNQDSESHCSALSKCAWTGEKCLGKELVTACSAQKSASLIGERSTIATAVKVKASPGSSGCPCIAISGALGSINATIGSSTLLYPADLGGSCETWDDAIHPDCKGDSLHDWCRQAWCYVDPTNCNGLSLPPKVSAYQPQATFNGMTLYYSYVTCGSSDSWTTFDNPTACINQKTEGDCTAKPKCAWTGSPGKCLGKELVQKSEFDAAIVGNATCRCVGVANSSGSVVATYPQGHLSIGAIYPSDVGSHCNTWDLHSNPDCVATGGPQPDYCSQQWCYVDPCSCGLESPPTTSLMLPGATYQGKTLYYSYATCGGEDSFTSSSHSTACVNQETESSCSALLKCAWTGEKCLGKELATECEMMSPGESSQKSGARIQTTILPFALLLATTIKAM